MKRFLTLALAVFGAPAAAHPHVFVEASIEVYFEQGQASAVKMEWEYDDLFSLLLAEDMGLDGDADGEMTDDEKALLSERVTAWPVGYEGALHVEQNGAAIALGAPQRHSASYGGGRMRETLVRQLEAPIDPAAPLEIRLFEPEFYTAYDISGPVRLSGTGAQHCMVEIERADVLTAQREVEELIGRLPRDVAAEEAFPAVGDKFADRIVISCNAQ